MMGWNWRCRMSGLKKLWAGTNVVEWLLKNQGRIRHCQFIKSFSDNRCPALLPPIAVECTLCILCTVYHESKLLKIYCRLKSWLTAKSCVLPSFNPVGEIDSGYHADVYDCNRLLLPILRQKLAQSCGVYWLAGWLLLWGSKYLEHISSIGKK